MSSTHSSKSIVIDTGPLIAFSHLDWFDELSILFNKLYITEQVFMESQFEPERPDSRCIQVAVSQNKLQKSNCKISALHKYSEKLGAGEISSIELATRLNCLVILDDKHARQFAHEQGVPVLGTAGILIYAKQQRIIRSVVPLLQRLKEKQYYLSESLIEKVIKMADE